MALCRDRRAGVRPRAETAGGDLIRQVGIRIWFSFKRGSQRFLKTSGKNSSTGETAAIFCVASEGEH